MAQLSSAQQQVLTLLHEVLSQQGDQMPNVPLQRFQYALRTLVYACPRTADGYQTAEAYYVLVQAMHEIYHHKESTSAPWLTQVEEVTYDAFIRLQRLC